MDNKTCLQCQKTVTEEVDLAHFHLYNFCELCYLEVNHMDDDESWAKGC